MYGVYSLNLAALS